jgi:hypothetical protein
MLFFCILYELYSLLLIVLMFCTIIYASASVAIKIFVFRDALRLVLVDWCRAFATLHEEVSASRGVDQSMPRDIQYVCREIQYVSLYW